MWTYTQSNGEMQDPTGAVVGAGYSGAPQHVNDASAEQIPGVGPCPRGLYTFGPSWTDGHLGTVVMALTPVAPFDAYGRSLLRLHGDNALGNQSASEGCIIMPHDVRVNMDASTDRELLVV